MLENWLYISQKQFNTTDCKLGMKFTQCGLCVVSLVMRLAVLCKHSTWGRPPLITSAICISWCVTTHSTLNTVTKHARCGDWDYRHLDCLHHMSIVDSPHIVSSVKSISMSRHHHVWISSVFFTICNNSRRMMYLWVDCWCCCIFSLNMTWPNMTRYYRQTSNIKAPNHKT